MPLTAPIGDREVIEGDIVSLRSGGIKMTVGALVVRPGLGKAAICFWSLPNPAEIKSMEIYISALLYQSGNKMVQQGG
jgi:hypothetical protein